jgi:hypothetical protein
MFITRLYVFLSTAILAHTNSSNSNNKFNHCSSPAIIFVYSYTLQQYSYSYTQRTTKSITMSGIAAGRLKEERKMWRRDHPYGFYARPVSKGDGSSDIMKWEAGIPGAFEFVMLLASSLQACREIKVVLVLAWWIDYVNNNAHLVVHYCIMIPCCLLVGIQGKKERIGKEVSTR